jgi:hypothetical protein
MPHDLEGGISTLEESATSNFRVDSYPEESFKIYNLLC